MGHARNCGEQGMLGMGAHTNEEQGILEVKFHIHWAARQGGNRATGHAGNQASVPWGAWHAGSGALVSYLCRAGCQVCCVYGILGKGSPIVLWVTLITIPSLAGSMWRRGVRPTRQACVQVTSSPMSTGSLCMGWCTPRLWSSSSRSVLGLGPGGRACGMEVGHAGGRWVLMAGAGPRLWRWGLC